MPKYRKTFLDQVIVRVDFAVPPKGFEESVPVGVNKKAVEYFPAFLRQIIGGL